MLDFRDIGGRIVHGVQLEITAVYRGAVTWCYWHLAPGLVSHGRHASIAGTGVIAV